MMYGAVHLNKENTNYQLPILLILNVKYNDEKYRKFRKLC